MPFGFVMDLFAHWEDAPPANEMLCLLAAAFTDWEPRSRAVKRSTPPEQIAQMVASPKGFGGQVHGLEGLPPWMLAELDKLRDNPPKPN